MKKITASYIAANLTELENGQHIEYRGAEYWSRDGIIYRLTADQKLTGRINGTEFARIENGSAYRI